MYASEARAFPSETNGCAAHSTSDCLCDVQPIAGGVPVRQVPFAERLMELGLTRASFVTWAEELTTWHESQSLRLVAEA